MYNDLLPCILHNYIHLHDCHVFYIIIYSFSRSCKMYDCHVF